MTSRLLRAAAGSAIGLTVQGDPAAEHTVLLCHPAPGCSGFDPDPLVTNSRSVRILSADRPGYGASDPERGATIGLDPTIADRAVLDELRSAGTRLDGVVGWGFGGLVALRLAAALPDEVDRVVLVQTSRPHSPLYGLLARRSRAWMQQHHDPLLARSAFEAGTGIRSLSLVGAGPSDEALRLPGLASRLEHMLDRAALQGDAGVQFDRHAWQRRDWSRVLGGIRADVLLVYGERDERIGPGEGDWFARHLPTAEIEWIREAGPLAIASEWDRILRFVTATGKKGS